MSEKEKEKLFTRRNFLVGSAVGFGVILGGGYMARGMVRRYIADFANSAEVTYNNSAGPNIWFEVLADNTIMLHSPKVEMGARDLHRPRADRC